MANKRRRAETRRRGFFYRLLCTLVTIISVLFSLGVFFKAEHIEVEGAAVYAEREIIDASGIESGGSLFLLNGGKAGTAIRSAMPYIRNVKVSRRFPDTVRITVEESQAVAYIPDGSLCWILDQDCRVLEKGNADETEGLIWIKGLTPESAEIGQEIGVQPEDSEKKSYLAAVLNLLLEKDMRDKVSAMDVANSANLRFYYDERFVVTLGKQEALENKLEMLKITVEQRSALDRGTIAVSSGNQANYIPNT